MFTITGGSISKITIPLVKPFVTSFGSIAEREIVLVSLETKEGAIGWGEAPVLSLPVYGAEIPESAIAVIARVIFPRVRGVSFAHPEELDTALGFIRGNEFAKSAVIMAAYDLYGQLGKKRLVDLIGGTRNEVQNSATISIHERPEDAIEEARGYYDAGIRFLKLKIKPGFDYEHARAIRESFPEAKLMLDANASYAFSPDAIAILKKCDALGLYCLEQPFRARELLAHAKLQREIKAPLALDESVESYADAEQVIELGSAKLVNVKIARVGGLVQALAINKLCAAHGVPAWVGGMLESPVGLYANLALASVPNFDYPIDFLDTFTYLREYASFFTRVPFEIRGGTVAISLSGYGLGLELDWERCRSHISERIPLA
ncbi:MAG: o-succinylbenzoate synthase [Candidatus Liptonbacteria bacterium]|nr:o-succinylbenzoate synthase [Candidatus Liptonbacteria bacterium]